ncbi:PadR family transcriptional regulator [Edaphobacter bradus]|uniref:PadR family transcriptional regulator n=1 Tax=Edaphobacter bradus TaxID=2259016 RepID=UPI0021E049F8|nr:PadR family transcriptional regulator [Edaphobacter bradus]
MDSSVLDIFILSLLDRGHETTYDLQRQAGLSLGSTVPALRRLEAKRLITRQETFTPGSRPRNAFALTAAGRKLARNGWKPLLDSGRSDDDLEAVLRIAEMARANNAHPVEIKRFLAEASRTRLESAKVEAKAVAQKPQDYVTVRDRWSQARLQAEAKFLTDLADEYRKPTRRTR